MRINNISYLTLKYSNSTSFGNKQSDDTKKFVRLRNSIEEDISKLDAKEYEAEWNFSANSTPENLKAVKRETKRKTNYFSNNNDTFRKLKKIKQAGNIHSKRLRQHLETLLSYFNISTKNGSIVKEIAKKEKEINKKFNSQQRQINGKNVTEADINLILDKSKDENLREKAYYEKANAGDAIAEDIIDLVKMRNDFAKKRGYENFYDYEYDSTQEMPLFDLLKLVQTVYSSIKEKRRKFEEKNNQKLAHIFRISPDKLMRYHKSFLIPGSIEDTASRELNTTDKVIQTAMNAYNGMGFDIESMPISMDLYPRENKDTGSFCIDIIPGKDVRLMVSLTGGVNSLKTLMHELGHAVYGVRPKSHLSYLDQRASNVMDESIALMMEDVARLEIIKKLAEKNTHNKNEFSQYFKEAQIDEIISNIFDIEFERELYKNPYQDPKVLWKNLMSKYYFDSDNEPLSNRWAINTLLVDNPAYTPGYFLADLIKIQMYSALKKQFGELTSNPNVAPYLNNKLFKYGSSISNNELVNKITGENISAESFCEITK